MRHPDRPAPVRCNRCERPACAECLHEAAVGYQCVDCVREAKRTTRRPTTVVGAEFSSRLIIVPILIVLNVAVYAYTAFEAGSLNQNHASQLFEDWQLWPPVVASGEWWRLDASGFLHYGPIHLALNMLALFILGRDLEPVFGRLRFIAVYLISLVGGSTAVYLFGSEDAAVAGASGAVFGLMGALVVVAIAMRINPTQAIGIIAINVFISITIPGISLLGHVGGLVTGAIAAAALVYAPKRGRNGWQLGTLVVLTVALIGLIVVRDAQFGEVTCEKEPVLRCHQWTG